MSSTITAYLAAPKIISKELKRVSSKDKLSETLEEVCGLSGVGSARRRPWRIGCVVVALAAALAARALGGPVAPPAPGATLAPPETFADPQLPAGFYGADLWYLPGFAAVVDRAPAPKAPEPAARRTWRRKPRSRAIESLKKSGYLLRKARGRTYRSPVYSAQFMDGVAALMPAFEAFGQAIHAAAEKDVLGNVKKLKANGAPRKPIPLGVAEDVTADNAFHPDSTAQAFLWLKRILRFTAGVFETLEKRPDLEMNACLTRAYEAHLGLHHNVVMRQIAVILMQVIPDRNSMLGMFGVEREADVYPHMRAWTAAAMPLVQRIDYFLKSQGLPT